MVIVVIIIVVVVVHVVGEHNGVNSRLDLEQTRPHEGLTVPRVDMGFFHKVVAVFVFGVTEISASRNYITVV